jgi:hypothetical protein
MKGSMKGRFQKYFGGGPFRRVGSSAGDFTACPAAGRVLALGICLVQFFFFLTLAVASEGAEGGHKEETGLTSGGDSSILSSWLVAYTGFWRRRRRIFSPAGAAR